MRTPTPTVETSASPLDVTSLARLAQSLFEALPGVTPSPALLPSQPQPAGVPVVAPPQAGVTQAGGVGLAAPGLNLVPTGLDALAAAALPSRAQLPHAAVPDGTPDVAWSSLPALDRRLGVLVPGVPPLGLDAGPGPVRAGRAAGDAPAAPFYFVAEREVAVPVQRETTAQTLPAQQTQPHRGAALHGLDLQAIRADFPILSEQVNGRPLVWFDNAATTHKPRAVIERLAHYYAHENSNVHRAAHALAARSTDAYERARAVVARHLNAASPNEIVWVRGATDGINFVANSWGEAHIGEGDEIVLSHLEHHANIVPWQQLAARRGARLRVIPVDDSGQIRLDEYRRLLGPRTRLVAVTHVSNALGTVVPVHEVVALARQQGIATLVDGAQSVSHLPIDVQGLGCDFFVFSGHKVFGPTGIGAVYGRREVLQATPPWQGGGNMIEDVTFEHTRYQGVPARFEAGTGNIADAVGLAAALEYLQRLGLPRIAAWEHQLLDYATHRLRAVPGLRIIGTAADKTSVLSFVLHGHEPQAVGRALDAQGIAVRSGHHCAQPILRRFGLEATVRPSFAFYNTCEEIDLMAEVLQRLARG